MKLIPFMKYRNWLFGLSLVFLIPGFIMFLTEGLKFGIDFTGGSMLELQFKKTVTAQAVTDVLHQQKLDGSQVQISDGNIAIIRTKPLDNQSQTQLTEKLRESFGEFQVQRIEVVGPIIGEELKSNAIWSIGLMLLMIIGYISYRFRYDFALCAILALLHDVLFLIGAAAILGHFYAFEVDTLFVTAVLTVAGFSVHDTIVVFDRVRENSRFATKGKLFEEIANDSLNQTWVRSVNTSVSVCLPLLALVLFGGASIHHFSLMMLIGIISGTYSSIFVATALLVVWRDVATRNRQNRRAALQKAS